MGIEEKGFSWFSYYADFTEIAAKGDIEMFKLLLEKGVDIKIWMGQVLPAAVSNNQLRLLKWLHRNNLCEYDAGCKSYVVLEAIKTGNVQIFKWAQNVLTAVGLNT